MSYTIRSATIEDLPILLAFEQGVIDAERPMDPTIKSGDIHYYDIPELIQSPAVHLLVAETNGTVVGSGYARIKADRHYLKHNHQGYLGFMYVEEPHRGKGVNQLIIAGLVKWCRAMNVHEIRLDVYDTNIAAIKAYEKVGFYKHLITMRMPTDPSDH
jgi:RimJ/RimL family protein N-acetyltransferase